MTSSHATTAKVRVGRRVAAHVLESTTTGDPLGQALQAVLRAKTPTKAGVRLVELDADGQAVLAEYASALADSAADSVGYETSALGDINAARAVLRQLPAL